LDVKEAVIEEIEGLLARRDQRVDKLPTVREQTALFAEGLALESLEVAELSATLEDDLGRDPYSEGQTPRTVGEVLDFYEG